jgi:hypothetical protein
MTEFRDSLVIFKERISKDKRFSSADKTLLKDYIDTLDQMLQTQDKLPFFDLIKDPKRTADEVLVGISKVYSSENFITYGSLLAKLIAAQDSINAVLEKNGPKDPTLTCFKESTGALTIRPVQHSPRYPLQFKTIKDSIEKVLKLATQIQVVSSLYSESSLSAVNQVLKGLKTAPKQLRKRWLMLVLIKNQSLLEQC